MTDGEDGAAKAAQHPVPKVELKRGDFVAFEGLKTDALNGLQGTLLRLDAEAERWEVKMPDGEVKAIRPVNLTWRGIGPVEDDGSLTLIGLASDNAALQKAVSSIGEGLPSANQALVLVGSVISPSGGANAQGEEARIWVKLAKQAEQSVRGALEDLQKNVELVDGIETSRLSRKAADELKMARRDLIRTVQSQQEQLENALDRLRPVLQHLVNTVPKDAGGKRHGWSEGGADASLHEKYRAAFEKMEESVEKTSARKTKLSGIVVKYQGKGDNPPPSDNLYVKGLPGWVLEEDVKAIFSQVGQVMSLHLKVADWGAIAFVRMTNRKECAMAIQKFNGTVPDVLEKKTEEQEGKQLDVEITKAALRATVDQLARGVIVVVDIREPLGVNFSDTLVAKGVQEDSQAFELGIRKGWRVRSIGGIELSKTDDLIERLKTLKSQGLKQAAIVFTPPPVVASFSQRPFGLAVAKDPELGLIYVADANRDAKARGIRRGAVVAAVGGQDVSGLECEQVTQMLKEVVLPVSIVFEQAQALSGGVENQFAAFNDGDGEDELSRSALIAEALPPPVELDIDLSQPLGIVFDDHLVAKSVKFNSQAQRLGIAAGWKALRLAGVELTGGTQELLEKVGKLKADGLLNQFMSFQPTPGSKPVQLSAEAAGAALRERAAAAQAAAAAEADEQGRKSMRRVDIELDLSQPLGIGFSKSLYVETVQEGSQGARLGVAAGWRALSLGETEFANTKELVERIQALKKEGSLGVSAVFLAPQLSEPPKAEAAKAASPPAAEQVVEESLEMEVDLTVPLGIGFTDSLVAKDIKQGSQSEKLGIGLGWKVSQVAGASLSSTKELVAKLTGLKKGGATSVTITFLKRGAENADESATKRQKTS